MDFYEMVIRSFTLIREEPKILTDKMDAEEIVLMKNLPQKIFSKYMNYNSIIHNSHAILYFFVFSGFLISLLILIYYTKLEIADPRTFYDVDGWANIIQKMADSENPWALLSFEHVNHYRRGFLIPFIYGLSYCILKIPESVHILNIIIQSLNTVILIHFFNSAFRKPVLGFLIGCIWAGWPLFSFYYGYYYPEPIMGLVAISIFICSFKLLKKPTHLLAVCLGALFAIALHIKITFLLMVLLFFVFFFILWFSTSKKMVFTLVVSFLIIYGIYPAVQYSSTASDTGEKIVLTNEAYSGNFWHKLWELSYIPRDSMTSDFLSTLPEYWEIKAKAEQLNPKEKSLYFKELALAQIFSKQQISLTAKKFLRFWFYIPPYKWIPSPKTFFAYTTLLVLAFWGGFRQRHKKSIQISILMVLGMWVFHGIIHAETRYHFAIFPFLLYLSFSAFDDLANEP